MATKRQPIPSRIASAILLANRHACCICQSPKVQIHHIDENASNNSLDNLAVLCLTHHDHASMRLGLTRKLKADEVRHYKSSWESKCASDIEALSRDRLRFYVTIYKNPPRIREIFSSLSKDQRLRAVQILQTQIAEDIQHHEVDKGFQWQAVPGDNDLTGPLLFSLRAGELWPRVLPRVGGHPLDPDYPFEMGPPNGMVAFHGYDLYCQLVVRTLAIVSPPVPLESIWSLKDPDLIGTYSGRLVSFRERSIGKNVESPRGWSEKPLGRVQFKAQKQKRTYRAIMEIKNMYVFSDTSAITLQRSKVCGVALLEDAAFVDVDGCRELHVYLKPLLIGMGGLGQSEDGWWKAESAAVGSRDAL